MRRSNPSYTNGESGATRRRVAIANTNASVNSAQTTLVLNRRESYIVVSISILYE